MRHARDLQQPFVCLGCGTQYAAAEAPPDRCPLCEGDRRPTTATRPAWATLAVGRHQNIVQRPEPDLFSIHTLPTFAAGQRALIWLCRGLLASNPAPAWLAPASNRRG